MSHDGKGAMKAHTSSSSPSSCLAHTCNGGMMEYCTTKGEGNVLSTMPHYFKEVPTIRQAELLLIPHNSATTWCTDNQWQLKSWCCGQRM